MRVETGDSRRDSYACLSLLKVDIYSGDRSQASGHPSPDVGRRKKRVPGEELDRMTEARAQIQEKTRHFRILAHEKPARGYQESLRDIECRIHALEMNRRPRA